MSDDTFSGADFSSAMTSGSAEGSPSPESSASAPVDGSATPGTATTAPGTATATSSAPATPAGPIPFDVHKTALENARTKAQTEYEQKYGWAKDYDAKEVQTLVQFRDALRADPATTLGTEIAELIQHPTYGPQLRSVLARHLGATGRAAAEPAAPELAPIPLQLEDGRIINVLPADQLAIFEQQVLEKARKEMAPALQSAKDLEAAKAHHANLIQADAFAKGLAPEITSLPYLKEHAAEVRAKFAQMDLPSDHPAEVTAAFFRAYHQVIGPKLAAAGQQAQLKTIHDKVNAGSISNPSSTTVSAPTPLKDLSWEEGLKREFARRVG